jgi:hypothetical protein
MPEDRDKYKAKTPPAGVRAQTASPTVEVDEDVTGKHELGEVDEHELATLRAKRPTDERLARLEAKNDQLVAKLIDLATHRTTVTVEVDKARAIDDIEQDRKDREAARDFKIRLGALVIAGLTGLGMAIAAFLHGCS